MITHALPFRLAGNAKQQDAFRDAQPSGLRCRATGLRWLCHVTRIAKKGRICGDRRRLGCTGEVAGAGKPVSATVGQHGGSIAAGRRPVKSPQCRGTVTRLRSSINRLLTGARDTMATQIVMDHTGDTRHQFDPADVSAVAEAERRFKELTGVGFTAAKRLGDGKSEVLKTFDPTAEETLFIPRLQGG